MTDGRTGEPEGSVDLGRRVRWEEGAQGRLLIFDCSNNTLAEAYALFDAFEDAVRDEPEGSVYVLADLENAAHETALTRRWKTAVEAHNRKVAKIALLGVTGGMKVVIAAYRFYARVRGMDVETKMVFFDDEVPARIWLAER